MTPAEIAFVKDSFRKIAPVADQVTALFYARLFELDPSLRPLFRGDLQEQGRKLTAMIGLTVSSLERIDTLIPFLRQLGTRNASLGLRDEHYITAGTALLWTLEKALGPAFTSEVHAAWASTYGLLANIARGAIAGTEPHPSITAA